MVSLKNIHFLLDYCSFPVSKWICRSTGQDRAIVKKTKKIFQAILNNIELHVDPSISYRIWARPASKFFLCILGQHFSILASRSKFWAKNRIFCFFDHNFLIFWLSKIVHLSKWGRISRGIRFSNCWSSPIAAAGATADSAIFCTKRAENAIVVVLPTQVDWWLHSCEKWIPWKILPNFGIWMCSVSSKIRKLWQTIKW